MTVTANIVSPLPAPPVTMPLRPHALRLKPLAGPVARIAARALCLAGLYPAVLLALLLLDAGPPLAAFGALLGGATLATALWAIACPSRAHVLGAAAGMHLGTLLAMWAAGGPALAPTMGLALAAAWLACGRRRGAPTLDLDALGPYSHPAL